MAILVGTSAVGAETLTARLTMIPIEMATRANVSGEGRATAVLDGRTLSVEGQFSGLRGAATVARLHASPVTGVRGPIVAELSISPAAAGELSGALALDAAQVDSLLQGRWYIQIHSEAAPDGNLWGWLLPAAPGASSR